MDRMTKGQKATLATLRAARGHSRRTILKGAAAAVNGELGLLSKRSAASIEKAAAEIAEGKHDAQFPIDVFQTGSGTSTNMNANEVIAALATRRLGTAVHPNDDVNMGQSSNDAIPTAIHVSAALSVRSELVPALELFERREELVLGDVERGEVHRGGEHVV